MPIKDSNTLPKKKKSSPDQAVVNVMGEAKEEPKFYQDTSVKIAFYIYLFDM